MKDAPQEKLIKHQELTEHPPITIHCRIIETMVSTYTALVLLNVLCFVFLSSAFHVQPFICHGHPTHRHGGVDSPLWASQSTQPLDQQEEAPTREHGDGTYSVRAPLKYIGPYPSLGVRFPHLATAAQVGRNESGVTLDFVLDTAANTNTINAQVAQALNLEVTGQAAPGMSSTGAIEGDLPTYYFGDMQLEGLGESVFMRNLTASALPVAGPASAGLLSLAFFQSIGGGVEFDWLGDTEAGRPPSLTFYATDVTNATQGRTCVPISRIPVTQLPSVELEINGHVFPALLDTGSPVTVLNAEAAKQAGISTILSKDAEKPRNPLDALQRRFQVSQAASKGQVLSMLDSQGKRINLVQSAEKWRICMPGRDGDSSVDFEEGHVYVGDLPGLAALEGLGVDAPPAVVLGMDVLRRRSHMFFRPQVDELWL